LFDKSDTNEKQRTRIRLTGSVTIAALAFYGLKLATPAERLLGSRQNTVNIEISAVTNFQESARRLDRSVLEIEGCVTTEVDDVCKRKIVDLKSQSTALVQAISSALQKRDQ